MSNDLKKDLKNTVGDYAHAGTKILISNLVPGGAILSEIFDFFVSTPLDKRKEDWLIQLNEGVKRLEETVEDFKLENLIENELFQTIVLDATHTALKTHQELKRNALCNACMNTAKGINISEDKQLIFIKMIDQLTDIDLKLLLYFENPLKRFEERGEYIDTAGFGMGGIKNGLIKYYPDLNGQDEFVNNRVKNLHNQGLIGIDGINTVMSLNGIYAPRLTSLGKEFVSFIRQNT